MPKPNKKKIYTATATIALLFHIFAGTLCVIFVPHIHVFLIQNIIGIVYFAILLIFWKKFTQYKYLYTMIFLSVVLIWLQILTSAYTVGWDAGFQNFSFITLISAFFYINDYNHYHKNTYNFIVLLVSPIVYIAIFLICTFTEPVFIVSENFLKVITISNSIICFILIITISVISKNSFNYSYNKLRKVSEFDELTNLYNRRGMRLIFNTILHNWETVFTPYAICIMDIDDFKRINDTYGHNKGDEVLITISDVLRQHEAPNTTVCRWGGEEFLIVAKCESYDFDFIELINSIRESISKITFTAGPETFHVTMTAGISFCEHNVPIHELIEKADERLYKGKQNGKNQTVYTDLDSFND